MSRSPHNVISSQLRAIQRQWTRLKCFEYVGIAGILVCLAFFVMEECAERRFLTDPPLFFTLLIILGATALLSLPFILILVSLTAPERSWLAKQVEKGCPGLLDRVNTIVFLENGMARNFKPRIEAQAAQVIEKERIRSPLSSLPALLNLCIFAILLTGDIVYERVYNPFALLLNPPPAPSTLASHGDNPLEMAVAKPTPTPTPLTWGEVRIVDPGRDLKLTKIDVVQLQIEMAASGNLIEPEWITSVNGAAEVSHPLPKPGEPQYAVYQPVLYLDELKVQDWDVVGYYARVKTSDTRVYQSKVFFIDIKPFDQDVMKQFGKGGKGEKMKDLFQELNEIISKQRDELQATYQFQTQVYPTPAQRDQDLVKLAQTQSELALQTDHFYAKVSSELTNQEITMLLDQLSQAETKMNQSVEDLKGEVIPQAQQDERAALAALIESRKTFIKVAAEMGADSSSASDDDDDEHDPDAADSLKKLSQVTEIKDRQQGALDKLSQLKARQEALANAPKTATSKSEDNLKSQVDDLIAKNEDLFRGAQDAAAKFHADADAAKKQLDDGTSREKAHHYMDQAAGDLGDLQKTAEANHQMDQMAEAYALKKILDQNANQLGKEQQTPGSLTPGDKDALDRSAANAALSLKDIADQPNSGFKPDLSQALSQDKQAALQDSLSKLKNSPPGQQSQQAASDAKSAIDKMTQAFDKSVPGISQLSGKGGQGSHDGSTGGDPGDESGKLADLEKQLQSLILQPQAADTEKAAEQKQELDQVMAQLDDLMKQDKNQTPSHAAIIDQMNQVKKDKEMKPVPAPELKKLIDSIEALSGEIAEAKANQPPTSSITLIDDSKLPPGYRDRIHHYYQQLSNSR